MMAWPTQRDMDVLGELRAATDNYIQIGCDGFVRPLDCGGSDSSDHSYRLTKLAKRGLAEVAVRSSGVRGSKVYRITDAGRSALPPAPVRRR